MMRNVAGGLRTIWAFTLEFHKMPIEMILITFLGLIIGYTGSRWNSTGDFRDIKGATVLVTGASKGIGEEIAYAFSKHGARLLLTARSEEALKKVALECKRRGASQAYYVRGDMSKESDVHFVYQTANEKFHNKIDYLILNHASQVTPTQWTGSDANMTLLRTMHEINFYSYVKFSSLVLEQMESNRGRIVVISSVIGKLALPFFSPYSSSKFAIQGFFGTLQHELHMKSSAVSVTLAALGRIDTETQRTVTGGGNFKRHGRMPPGERVDVAAEAVLSAAYHRKKEFFFPLYNRIGYILSTLPFVSDLIDKAVTFQFEKL